MQRIDVHNPSVNEVLYVVDPADGLRYVWNKEANGWAQEIVPSKDWKNWETVWQKVPMDALSDGSANISHALFMAEHPGLIPVDAPFPYYKAEISDNDNRSSVYYLLTIKIRHKSQTTDPNVTDVTAKSLKPYEYTGGVIFVDDAGNEFPTIVKANWDPTSTEAERIDPSLDQNTPTYHGFDKETFRKWMQNAILTNALDKKSDELTAVFPAPPGTHDYSPSTFYYGNQPGNPSLAKLLSPNMINMFDPADRAEIIASISKIFEPYDPVTNTSSVPLDSGLPDGIEKELLYSAITGW
jgi:hypothetical protein